MTRNYLAIPVGSLLIVTLLVPAFAQTDIDNPQGQVQTAATPPDQRPKLSEEDWPDFISSGSNIVKRRIYSTN